MRGEQASWRFGRSPLVPGCPRECPDRRAVPNCHNPETCAVWAEYVRWMDAIRAARREAHMAASIMTEARKQSARRRERDERRHRK